MIEKSYVTKRGQYLVLTWIGLSLMQTYSALGVQLHKPYFRGEIEAEVAAVACGSKELNQVRRETLTASMKVFRFCRERQGEMLALFRRFMAVNAPQHILNVLN